MVETVREDRMLAALRVDRDREPRREQVNADTVGI